MTIEEISAIEAITAATVDETPRATPRPDDVRTAEAVPPPPAGTRPAGTDGGAVFSAARPLDSTGAPFDPQIHEKRLAKSGKWALKRGNGARKVAGLPIAGNAGKLSPAGSSAPTIATPAAGAIPPAAAAAAGSAQPSRVVIPEIEKPADQVEAPADPAAYRETAEALTHGQFAAMEIWCGSAWAPKPVESKRWAEAWAAVLAHYRAPQFGPIARIVILALVSGAERRNDPETRNRFRGLFVRIGGWFGRRPVSSPAAAPSPAAAAGPADAAPARGIFG